MESSHHIEREELMAYLDGELRPEPAAAAATHLESCSVCRAATTDLHELSQQLAAWDVTARPTEMPAALSSAVDAHVSAQKQRTVAHRRSWLQILGIRRLIWAGGAMGGIVLLSMVIAPRTSSRLGAYAPAASPAQSAAKVTQISLRPNKGLMFTSTYTANTANSSISSNMSRASAPSMNADAQTGLIGDSQYASTSDGSYRLVVPSQVTYQIGAASVANDVEKPANGPMIVRTAQLSLITKDFNQARNRAEEILKRHGGYIGELNVNAPENSGRTLTATFRVPSAHLDAVLTELKKLGRVISESQGGEEVTQQYVELEARLANARHTEQRLTDLLRDRTGKLSDVLTFEKEIDRVRGEIESMEAQRKSLAKQVDYATLNATLSEEYGTPLQLTPPSTSMRFRNAAVEGYQAVAGGIVSVLLFLLSTGPSLLVLGAILFFAGRLIWKRVRERIA
jgi:hypothetical protein